jgi:hypothetical protein
VSTTSVPGNGATAQMSVVVVTDSYDTIRPVMARLRCQTARERLEVVIVAPCRQSLGLDESVLEDFAAVRVVEVGSIMPLGGARTAGVRAAAAPVVFIGETHSYPHPEFAAALIAAHALPWDVVVPAFVNANPESAFSWAAFLVDYGRWLDGLPAGEIDWAPTWNVAYKRPVLLEMVDRVRDALSQGDELAIEWRARGCRSYFEPAARIEHANVSRRAPWLTQRFLSGLTVAAHRSARWSSFRRLAYLCASPLIPAVVLVRIIHSLRLLARERRLPSGTIPALLLGAIVRTAGEIVGYARGAGTSAERRMDEFELHKVRYTSLPV